MIPYIFSAVQTQTWLTARHKGQPVVQTSYDLNLTSCQLALTPAGVELPNGQMMRWEWVEEITADENACFQWLDEAPQKVQFFSEELQRAYSLCPTESAPTMLVSGLTMHRIKGTNPRLRRPAAQRAGSRGAVRLHLRLPRSDRADDRSGGDPRSEGRERPHGGRRSSSPRVLRGEPAAIGAHSVATTPVRARGPSSP